MDALRCESLSKSFDGVKALDGVTLHLPKTGIIALVGPNGAGKTTLLNVITGFLRPDGGRCFLADEELTRLTPHRIVQLGIARTFQDLRVIKLISVLDNVMLARPEQKGEHLWRALTRFGVGAQENSNRAQAVELLRFVGLEERSRDPAGSLSYGQQKLLTLACCLATEAQILLLDEPIAGIHREMADSILGLLKELRDAGKLVVFIEHDLAAVHQIADTAIVMGEGKVVAQGAPGEILDRREIMEAYVA